MTMRALRSMRAATVAALMASAAACSNAFERPEVDLESVGLAGLGLTGGTLNVNLRVHNPNSFGFRSDRLDYQLFLRRADAQPGDSAWTRLAEGTYDDDIEVGARGTTRVTIPVAFTYAGLGEARRSLLNSGSFQYRAVGTVDARTSFGHRTVPFRKTGTFYMNGQTR
jgi:LEA14-like dessication related protein